MCDKEVFGGTVQFEADVAFTPRDELLERVTIAPFAEALDDAGLKQDQLGYRFEAQARASIQASAPDPGPKRT